MIIDTLNLGVCNALVLVIEDSDINATVVANNGKEALQINAKHVFDAILMDVQMPIMDGLEATRRIRETDQSIVIIGLSANVLPEDIPIALAAGMNGYLRKPV